MALEGLYNIIREQIVDTGYSDPITIAAKVCLKRGDKFAAVTGGKAEIVSDRRRRNPMPYPRGVQLGPRECFAGISLAARCNVGMGEYTIWLNPIVSSGDISTQGDNGLNLLIWELN